MGPILSHSKERERGPTVPRPLPGRIQSPGSLCVWTGCILNPAPSLGVWLAVLYGVLLFFISVGYGLRLLSEFLPQRRYRPMKRPLSWISGIPSSTFLWRIITILNLPFCYFSAFASSDANQQHTLWSTSIKWGVALNENATLYWSIVDGLDPAGATQDNTAQCLCSVIYSYAWESSFKAQIIHHCSLITSQGTRPKDWPVWDFNEHSIIKLFHFATPRWNGTTLYIFIGNRHQLL